MGKLLLIKFKKNWTDEFEACGFAFVKEDEWELFKFCAQNCVPYPSQACCDGNIYWEFESYAEYINCFEVREVSPETVAILEDLFVEGDCTLKGFYHSYGLDLPDIVDRNMDSPFYHEGGWEFIGLDAAKEIVAARE